MEQTDFIRVYMSTSVISSEARVAELAQKLTLKKISIVNLPGIYKKNRLSM